MFKFKRVCAAVLSLCIIGTSVPVGFAVENSSEEAPQVRTLECPTEAID